MLYDPKWEKQAVTLESWRKVLLDAAARIDQRGLAKGKLLGCDGSLCVLGAIQEVSGDTDAAIDRLHQYLKIDSIPSWNDAPFRTKGQVVSALRSCASI